VNRHLGFTGTERDARAAPSAGSEFVLLLGYCLSDYCCDRRFLSIFTEGDTYHLAVGRDPFIGALVRQSWYGAEHIS